MDNDNQEPDQTPQAATMDSDSPLSPRIMAVATLKRAASLREGAPSSSANASPASALPPRAAGLARPAVLERSASDAARRLAMAKLTGEKVTGCVIFLQLVQHACAKATWSRRPMIMPKVPLPTLADLQARHEQKAAAASPHDDDAGDSSHAASSSLSRSASASAASSPLYTGRSLVASPMGLERSASAASSSKRSVRSPNLQQSPSIDAVTAGFFDNAVAPEASTSQVSYADQRQEARSNLIRKLSRGRQATGAAAAARERAAQRDTEAGDSKLDISEDASTASSLQIAAEIGRLTFMDGTCVR